MDSTQLVGHDLGVTIALSHAPQTLTDFSPTDPPESLSDALRGCPAHHGA
jgi:hypothetical protein